MSDGKHICVSGNGVPLRCDVCGKFIPWGDLFDGKATRAFLTPDSEFTKETYETLCAAHALSESASPVSTGGEDERRF